MLDLDYGLYCGFERKKELDVTLPYLLWQNVLTNHAVEIFEISLWGNPKFRQPFSAFLVSAIFSLECVTYFFKIAPIAKVLYRSVDNVFCVFS